MKNRVALFSLSTGMSAVLLTSISVVWSQQAQACGPESYTGEVCLTAASFCPEKTVEANGVMMEVATNAALFSLLGCQYGGDCRTTFALPDLRGRAPVHYGTPPGAVNHPWGRPYGNERIVMSQAQLANHSHQATVDSSGGQGEVYASGVVSLPVTASAKIATSVAVNSSNTPTDHAVLGPTGSPLAKVYSGSGTVTDLTIGPEGAVTGVATGPVRLPVTGVGSIESVTIKSAGGSAPIYIEGPRLAMRYCIVVNGIYPPRG